MATLKKRLIPFTMHFAFDGERAGQRPLFVFIHHFGGSEATSKRHVMLINEMGFDAVTFNLSWHGPERRKSWHINLFHQWSKEITAVLQELGSRPKILFSFSGPSDSALESILHSFEHGKDIVALICDSGPFLHAKSCTRTMLKEVYGIQNILKREMYLALMSMAWGFGHDRKLLRTVQKIAGAQPSFPVLSIRGLNDKIIPLSYIEEAFQGSGLKGLTVLNIPAGHVTGIKDVLPEYKMALENFLKPWLDVK